MKRQESSLEQYERQVLMCLALKGIVRLDYICLRVALLDVQQIFVIRSEFFFLVFIYLSCFVQKYKNPLILGRIAVMSSFYFPTNMFPEILKLRKQFTVYMAVWGLGFQGRLEQHFGGFFSSNRSASTNGKKSYRSVNLTFGQRVL